MQRWARGLSGSLASIPPVLLLTASLLQRLRIATLAMLIVVLPLQGMVQWVAGWQGQRHVHTHQPGSGASASALSQWLDRLHAAQPAQLKAPGLMRWAAIGGEQPHAHGAWVHTHGAQDTDAVPVADADDGGTPGATAFLAWLPTALRVSQALPEPAPSHVTLLPAGREVAPALTPPRA